MKKKIIGITFVFAILLIITGCNKKKIFIGEESDKKVFENDVSLSVKEGTLTSDGVTLLLKNNGNVIYEYGEPYEIEVLIDNKWHNINLELFFILPIYHLSPGETKELNLSWEKSYGKLDKGTYRIIKTVKYLRDDGYYDSHNVAAEITLK